jgi:hypothetical protein
VRGFGAAVFAAFALSFAADSRSTFAAMASMSRNWPAEEGDEDAGSIGGWWHGGAILPRYVIYYQCYMRINPDESRSLGTVIFMKLTLFTGC